LVIGSYIDFKGQDRKFELTIYDEEKTKNIGMGYGWDQTMGITGCSIKLDHLLQTQKN
jgi:hypothetical protein